MAKDGGFEDARALLSGWTLVCVGYHPWSPMWKRNQSMVSEFARQGLVKQVVFVNPAVSPWVSPRRLRQEWGTVARYSYLHMWPRRPEARVRVVTPVDWLPFSSNATVARLNEAVAGRTVLAGTSPPVALLINTPRPEDEALVARLAERAKRVFFDWSDDFSRFSLRAERMAALERVTERWIRRADVVLTVNPELERRARAWNAAAHTVPNATGMRPRQAGPLPAAVAAWRRQVTGPVLGYAGYISPQRIDVELIATLARAEPGWHIVFLGIVQRQFDRRDLNLANVHFLPAVPHAALQEWLAAFDVCLLPHLINEHTAGNNPLKLYDYLAAGPPVVSTRIAGLEGFEDVVAVVDTHEAFVDACRKAVKLGAEPGRPARLARAGEHHWSARARQAAQVLATASSGRS